jgi:hypothetical protein
MNCDRGQRGGGTFSQEQVNARNMVLKRIRGPRLVNSRRGMLGFGVATNRSRMQQRGGQKRTTQNLNIPTILSEFSRAERITPLVIGMPEEAQL